MKRIMDLMWTDPDELLPEDRGLMSEDFKKLAKADAIDQEYWIAETEVAIKAARYSHDSTNTRAPDDEMSLSLSRRRTDPEIDTEGSIQYRRRRCR